MVTQDPGWFEQHLFSMFSIGEWADFPGETLVSIVVSMFRVGDAERMLNTKSGQHRTASFLEFLPEIRPKT